jgi:hypothetical protein
VRLDIGVDPSNMQETVMRNAVGSKGSVSCLAGSWIPLLFPNGEADGRGTASNTGMNELLGGRDVEGGSGTSHPKLD